MPLDDWIFDVHEQALGREIRTAFSELSLSPAQRQRLNERFARRAGGKDRVQSLVANDASTPDWAGVRSGQTEHGSKSRVRRLRISRGLEAAAVVLLLALFASGLLVARTLIPSGGTSQSGPVASTTRGGQIAFASDRSGIYQIYTVFADGTNLRQLTSGPDDHTSPIWSPDGKSIAYFQTRFFPPAHSYGLFTGPPGAWPPISIYVMNADGSNARDLTPTAIRSFHNLSWSPDSTQLAFECSRDGSSETDGQICVLNVDGSGIKRIAPENISMTNPIWSPDGRWIAASGQQSPSQPYEIYLVSPGSGEWRKLATDVTSIVGFVWSPDGSQLAIVQSQPVGSTAYGTITVVNVDGSGQHDINVGDSLPSDLVWSPDGTRILFNATVPGTARAGVDVVNTDGTGLREVVPEETGVISVAWSPDGQAIAYTRYTRDQSLATPGGNYYTGIQLDVIRLSGSSPVTVFSQMLAPDQTGLDGSPPAWRPVAKK